MIQTFFYLEPPQPGYCHQNDYILLGLTVDLAHLA